MAPEWIYLLKVNVGITLFYAFYKLLCQRDTFFLWRRIAILSFLGISFVYPLLNIQEWVNEQPAFSQLTNYYTALATEEITIIGPHIANSPRLPEIMTIAMYIYATGAKYLCVQYIHYPTVVYVCMYVCMCMCDDCLWCFGGYHRGGPHAYGDA